MKIYTVLSDGREDANNIIVTTDNEKVALNVASEYLQRHNVGEDDYWTTVDDMIADFKSYDTIKEGILQCCNNAWLNSPTYVEYELNDIEKDF